MAKQNEDVIFPGYKYAWSPSSDISLKEYLSKVRHINLSHSDTEHFDLVQAFNGRKRWNKAGLFLILCEMFQSHLPISVDLG